MKKEKKKIAKSDKDLREYQKAHLEKGFKFALSLPLGFGKLGTPKR